MGHAHHFLSRLDRVGSAEVDLSLALYRDPEALRFVLGRASLPDRADRVAVELSDGPEPPALVVTRDGRFVTCLGAGMRHDLVVVTRAALDAGLEALAVVRQRGAFERAIDAGEAKGIEGALGKLSEGPDVSREDMTRLVELAPVLLKTLLQAQLEKSRRLGDLRTELVRILRKTGTLRAHAAQQLEAYFRGCWAVAHLAVVTGSGLGARARELAGDRFDHLAPTIALAPVETDVVGIAAHGLYGAGRLGLAALPVLGTQFARATSRFEAVAAVLGTFAIVARHPEAREEALRRLYAPGPAATAYAVRLGQLVAQLEALVFLDPDELSVAWPMAGAEMFVTLAKARLPEGHALRFATDDDVPIDLARAYAMRVVTSFQQGDEGFLMLASALPWMATARADELYLPADVLAWAKTKYYEERGVRLLAGHVGAEQAWVDAHARPAGPTRGGPCPCGSGKKYKRCCGEAAR
jgi:hypothetical protein